MPKKHVEFTEYKKHIKEKRFDQVMLIDTDQAFMDMLLARHQSGKKILFSEDPEGPWKHLPKDETFSGALYYKIT